MWRGGVDSVWDIQAGEKKKEVEVKGVGQEGRGRGWYGVLGLSFPSIT